MEGGGGGRGIDVKRNLEISFKELVECHQLKYRDEQFMYVLLI